MVLTKSQARRYRDGGGSGVDYGVIGAMIGDAVFDAMFAAEGSFHTYYNSTHGTYEVNPTTRTKLPMFNPRHAKKK